MIEANSNSARKEIKKAYSQTLRSQCWQKVIAQLKIVSFFCILFFWTKMVIYFGNKQLGRIFDALWLGKQKILVENENVISE